MEYERRTFGQWLINVPRAEIRSETPEVITAPSYSNSKTVVTLQTALSISAVYGSVNILTNWVSQMDLAVYKNGEAVRTPTLITQPDTNSTLYQFIKKTVTSLALTGDAFWKVTYNSAGAAVNLEVLNPLAMSVEQNDSGTKVFKYQTTTGQKTFNARQVTHIMTTEIPGRLRGLSPIEANNAGLQATLELRKYADNWFNSSGVPKGGYLTSTQELDSDELTQARSRWLTQMNDGMPPAMDNNWRYESVSLNPADAMFLEQQTFAITEIARWFGIPPYLLLASVDGNSMTYSNLTTDTRLFVTNTLMGYMMPIQEAFTGLLPRGQVVKFKTEALLRGDTAERYAAYGVAVQTGWLTNEEVRAAEGMPPIQTKEITDAA